jgi:succinyl-CoA synthetase beta subunit
LVKKLLIEQGLNIAKELYLSILPDRATAKMIIMASEAGGMDIEEVAEKTPKRSSRSTWIPMWAFRPTTCGRRRSGSICPRPV